jgi:hypothetical protein
MLCFYCNKEGTDKVYTSVHDSQINVHSKCVEPLKKLVQVQIYEYRSRDNKHRR